jgi:DNA helicase-2/ATP-dependent DNA helicase PcrA
MAEGLDAVEEERRLFYVGVTRASQALVLTFARARSSNAKSTRQPSRFLAAVDQPLDAGAAFASSVRRGSARRERVRTGPAPCRVCGKALVTGVERTLGRCATHPGSADEALYERLVAWRLNESRERSVPAFVIFTDATLRAIAELQPTTEAELLKISGIGARKLADYGEVVLELLRG